MRDSTDVSGGAAPYDRTCARRRIRSAALGVCLVAAGAGSAACSGVTIAPGDGAWTVSGEGREARAVWRAGDVEVAVPLHYAADASFVTADVMNHGPDVARLTFTVPSGSATFVPVGSVSGGAPMTVPPWTEPVLPGRPVDVPAGTPGRPGTLRFALRPDTRWGPDAAPVVGSAITLGLALATSDGNASCPLSFRVTESSDGGWSGMTETSKALVVLLLALVIAAACVWA